MMLVLLLMLLMLVLSLMQVLRCMMVGRRSREVRVAICVCASG